MVNESQVLKEIKKKIATYDSMKDQLALRKKDIDYYKMQLEVEQG